MKEEEKKRILDILTAVDALTSESKKPARLSEVVKLLDYIPAPSVYGWVSVAQKMGLVNKNMGRGPKFLTVTLKGYRLLEKKPSVSPSEARGEEFTYKQAYSLLSNLFIVAGALGTSEKKAILDSISKLITE